MTITLNADYDVTLNTALLGYVGETNARPVSVEGLTVDGADRYVLTIDYGDGTAYEVDITGGQWTPTADILRSAQTVSCQIAAKKLAGNEYILVKKSRIFRLRIGAAIGDTAIPSPSVAADALDRIDAIGRQVHADMQTAVTAAETATTMANNAAKSATAAEKSADTATQVASRAETAKTAAQIVSLVNRLYPLYMRWGSFTVNMKVNADNGSQWSYNTRTGMIPSGVTNPAVFMVCDWGKKHFKSQSFQYKVASNGRDIDWEAYLEHTSDQGGTYAFKVYYLIVGKNAEGGSIVG